MASSSVKAGTMYNWISEYPELSYDQASNKIYCSKCKSHMTTKKSNVMRHIEGAVHQGTFKRPQEELYFDLIQFLILCNIPWFTMNSSAFKDFFQKYVCGAGCCKCTNKKVPDESQLRKVYLDKIYKNKINSIHEAVRGEKLWISLDETADFLGRYSIVHFLIKPLKESFSGRPYLIACKILEVVNGEILSKFVIECLEKLWQDSFETKVNNVLILCTDSVDHMLSAGRNLKNYLPRLKHVTCLAHALHRVSEKIRKEHDVDTLISNVKKIFTKAPNRVKIFKEMYPNLPLPPQPVMTRWGGWLEAASYYAKYLDEIKDFLSYLNSSDSVAIQNAKDILEKDNIHNQFKQIEEYYMIILFAIEELQKQSLTLEDSFLAFDQVRAVMNERNSARLNKTIENVMDRSPDIDIIREYSEKLSSSEIKLNDLNEILPYKFAPLIYTDIESSIPNYKWILDVKRNRLKLENIEKILVIYFNYSGHDPPTSEVKVENEVEDSDCGETSFKVKIEDIEIEWTN